MSLGLIPIFKPKNAAKFSALGEALAENLEALEALARKKRLVPLSAFADQREVPDDFDGAPEELDALLGPCNDWFDPLAGADAIEKLARQCRRAKGMQAAVAELTALVACLKAAAKRSARFRLTLA